MKDTAWTRTVTVDLVMLYTCTLTQEIENFKLPALLLVQGQPRAHLPNFCSVWFLKYHIVVGTIPRFWTVVQEKLQVGSGLCIGVAKHVQNQRVDRKPLQLLAVGS